MSTVRSFARRSRTFVPVLIAATAFGCAHTSEEELERQKAQRQEMDVLKERVRRLERRLGDVDTKMDLLLEKPASGPSASAAPSSVSSGLPPPRPSSGYDILGSSRTVTPEPEPDPGPAVAVGPGARPIDIPPPSGDRIVDPDPSEPLQVGDEPDDGPTVIDNAAVARLGNRAGPEPYSRTPNRKISRSDTRPGPKKASSPRASSQKAAAMAAADRGAGPMPLKNVKRLYGWAMARREQGEFAQAIGAFEEVLRRYPDHHLADNAIYWTGVCHQSRGAPQAALKAWLSLPLRYPKSPKLPDALFGMAEVHETLGHRDTALDLYLQLIDQYPRAERASQARAALARLRG